MVAHLKCGFGIEGMRGFYNNKNLSKDTYRSLIQSQLRGVFLIIKTHIFEKYPFLEFVMNKSAPKG
jgi:hypothetical protein